MVLWHERKLKTIKGHTIPLPPSTSRNKSQPVKTSCFAILRKRGFWNDSQNSGVEGQGRHQIWKSVMNKKPWENYGKQYYVFHWYISLNQQSPLENVKYQQLQI